MSAEKAAKKGSGSYYIHMAIGLGVMILFFFLPAVDPITPLGMKVVGIFLMMVYTWSTLDTLWPSMLGLVMLGAIGADPAGFNSLWMNAIGYNVCILVLLAMVLFGGVDTYGCTNYIAKFFLTRKIFKHRPYVFMAIFFAACGVLSATIGVFIALILMWSIARSTLEALHITREDKIWPFFFVGMFLVITLMQPFFPFKGAPLIPLSAYQTAMGDGTHVPYLVHMITDIVMTILVMTIYLVGLKFVIRPDVSKLQAVDPAKIGELLPLPPMNLIQKIYLIMIPVYVFFLLVPEFIPKGMNPVFDLIKYMGPLGVTAAFVCVFLMVRIENKPLLNFKEVAYKQFNWGIFFMIAAAVYAAGLLSKPTVGVAAWLLKVLNPILGNQPEMVFVALMLFTALVITNFANNAAMATVLVPVIIAFSQQNGYDPTPIVSGVVLMVFVAMLTPAASPHAGMMHGNKEIYTTKEIMMIGLPMCLITLVMYIFIGYPLIKALLTVITA